VFECFWQRWVLKVMLNIIITLFKAVSYPFTLLVKMVQRVMRFLGFVTWFKAAFFVLILVFFLGMFFDSPYIHRVVEGLINKVSEDVQLVDIRFNKLQLSLIPLKAELFHLEVSDSESGESLVVANHVVMNVSFISLLLGQFRLSNVVCEEVLVHHSELMDFIQSPRLKQWRSTSKALQKPLEKLGLAQLQDADSGGYVFSAEKMVQRLIIRHGRFDQKAWQIEGFDFAARGFEVDLDFDGLDRGSGFMELDGLRVQNRIYSYIEEGRLDVDVSWEDGKFRFRQVDFQSRNVLFKGSILQASEQILSGDFQVQGQFTAPMSLLGQYLGAAHQSGWLKGDVTGKVAVSDKPALDLRGAMVVEDGILGGFQLLNSSFDYILTENRLDFSQLVIANSYGGDPLATGSGWIDFSSPTPYSFSLTPQLLSLSHIFQITKVYGESVDSLISGEAFRIYGTMQPFKLYASGTNTFKQLRIAHVKPSDSDVYPDCKLRFELLFDSKHMDFREATGECFFLQQKDSDPLSLDGTISFAKPEMHIEVGLQATHLKPYQAFTGLDIRGRAADIDLNIYRKKDGGISLALEGKADEVAFSGLDLDSVKLSLEWDIAKKLLLCKTLRSQRDSHSSLQKDVRSYMELKQGKYDYGKGLVNFAIKAEHIASEDFSHFMDLLAPNSDVSAQDMAWDLQVDMALERPDHLHVSGTMSGKDFIRDGHKLARGFLGDFSLKEGKLQFHHTRLKVRDSLIMNVSGRIDSPSSSLKDLWDPQAMMDIRWEMLEKPSSRVVSSPVTVFSDLPYVGGYFPSTSFKGILSSKGQMSGLLGAPSGKVVLSGKDIEGLSDISSFHGVWELQEGLSRYDISFGEAELSLTGNVDVLEKRYSVFLSGKNFDILPYLMVGLSSKHTLSQSRDSQNRVVMDGHMSLEGHFDGSLRGKLDISRLDVISAAIAGARQSPWFLTLESPASIAVDNGVLKMTKPLVMKNQWTRLRLALDPVESKLEDVNFALLGKMESRIIKAFFPKFRQISGPIQLEGYVGSQSKGKQGSRYKLALSADKANPLTVGYEGMYPLFRDVTFEAYIDDSGLYLAELHARKGSGRLKASGMIPWSVTDSAGATKPASGIDIEMKGGLFRFDSNFLGPVATVVDADLFLKNQPWLLSGQVDIVEAQSRRSLNIFEDLLMVNVVNFEPGFDSSTKEGLSLDIKIQADESLRVDNYPLSLVAGGDIDVKGSSSQPIISGYVDIPRGKVFYKREYEIIEGSLLFEYAVDFNPFLEARAQTQVGDYLVIVEMRGYFSDPTLEFYTDPPTRQSGEALSRFDILYLMANGRLPERDLSWGLQQEVLLSEGLNIAFNMVNQRIAEVITLDENSFIQDFNISSFTSARTGETRLRAEAPINTGQEKLGIILRSDVEALGLRAEYELDDNVATSLNYFRLIDPQSQERASIGNFPTEKVDASLGLRFRFSFP